MARKQESREVKVAPAGEGTEPETVTVMITALDGNTAGELGIRLLQMFGPSLVGMITAWDATEPGKAAEQASAFFSKLSPAEFKAIRTQLFRGAQVQEMGEFSDLDEKFIGERFSGHVGSLFSLVAFALKVNFANFFDDLGMSKELLTRLRSAATAKAAKLAS